MKYILKNIFSFLLTAWTWNPIDTYGKHQTSLSKAFFSFQWFLHDIEFHLGSVTYCTNFSLFGTFGDFNVATSLFYGHCQNVLRCRKMPFLSKVFLSGFRKSFFGLLWLSVLLCGFECFIALLMEEHLRNLSSCGLFGSQLELKKILIVSWICLWFP